MDKVRLKINGEEIEAEAGKTLLQVIRENNLDEIPTLCYSQELGPDPSCFLCVVEVKGKPNLVPSCATVVAPGMEVETKNERIVSARRMALELLISNHYADCVSPCTEGCPAGVDVQGYIALSAMGEYIRAVDLIREKNPLPAVCGRVCVRKCEVVCRRKEVDEAVSINAIKRFVTDIPGIYDDDPKCEASTGKTIAIVGAGPAGLTAAWFLAKKGHKPVIYESQPRSGGMLRYGIPAYRLPDKVIDAEVDYICRAGVEIRYNTKVGKDVKIDELMQKHDAVFIATGAWKARGMNIEGEDEVEGVVKGIEFLRGKRENQEPISGTVAVVGGGNTAIDVARTSLRLGADKVIILYRRTRAEMPADKMEIKDCLEEGVELMELVAPIGIVADKGKLSALKCIRMKLGEPDESGRRRPIPLEGSQFELPCQLAVSAIGQSPIIEGLAKLGKAEVSTKRWGTFEVNTDTMETNVKGLFAGGDAADDGPTVVIDAIRDGQRAAKAIHSYITGVPLKRPDFRVRKEFWAKPTRNELGDVKESPRHDVHLLDVEQRKKSFEEVATGFDYEDNEHECERCLSCGCVSYYECDLRRYAEEYDVDMEEFKGYVRKHKVDDRHPYIVYDPNKCILCTRCIRTCAKILPIPALGLVNRGFKTEVRPSMDAPLLETSCVSCGNCVDSCPTGALTVKYPFPGRAALHTEDVASHCGFCSLACPITVKKFGEKRYFIASSGIPGDYLCRYGRFGYELFVKKKRIVEPEMHESGSTKKVEMDLALQTITSRLKESVEAYGADKVAVFVSPDLTNEELYLASKIAREGLQTNNIASLSLLSSAQESGILDEAFGFTGSTSDRQCIKDADLIICNNTSIESDHLVLGVDIIEAVKGGARLIVVNSAIGTTDQMLSAVTMDPMRGKATLLWLGVIKALEESGFFSQNTLAAITDMNLFTDKHLDFDELSLLTGVSKDAVQKAADIIANAKKTVVIHCPDRPQDRAEGDMAVLADFVILLKRKGVRADLLLPRSHSNGAGIEIMGADPAFLPGRLSTAKTISEDAAKGATNLGELRKFLEEGKLKAAFVIGEDPISWNRTESWFRNVEFLAAMDWTPTETTRAADIVLPASTYLEECGSRCNFEGRVIEYTTAVKAPAGISSKEILIEMAKCLELEISGDISEEMKTLIEKKTDKAVIPFCFNSGQIRKLLPKSDLVKVRPAAELGSIPLPLTQHEKYKSEIINVGSKYFKVT